MAVGEYTWGAGLAPTPAAELARSEAERLTAHVGALADVRDAAAAVHLRADDIRRKLGPCREVSMALTKLEECGHWLRQLAERIEAAK